ncbi:MAG: hydroxymethylbilane synthase [Acidimicrobiales bacterium]
MHLRAATRGSPLALWQTRHVQALLADQGVVLEPVVVSTTGDERSRTPIREMGGKGVFVKEVQAAVIHGDADIAVHSMKDLPARTPDPLVVAAVPKRADPRDALVGSRLEDLRVGAKVATGAPRRRAQLGSLRPDIEFHELRGNIATRLSRVGEFDAVIVAVAALERLGLTPEIVEPQGVAKLLPQVGQGALAIECRADAPEVVETLRAIQHSESRAQTDVERGFLAELGGDCDLPAAAYAELVDDGQVWLRSMLSSPDGSTVLRDDCVEAWSTEVGRGAARRLLDAGGSELLSSM